MDSWVFIVVLLFTSLMGFLLNGFILLVLKLLGKQQQQTPNLVLLLHLGVLQTAACLIILIFTGLLWWSFTGTWCVLQGFLLALLHPIILWTIVGFNCERYYAIVAPLHYTTLVSSRRVIIGLAVSWTGTLLLCLPPLVGLVPPYKYNPGLGYCAADFGNGAWGIAAAFYGAVYIILGLGLPIILVTICNLHVLKIARYHRHRIANAIYEVTLSAQVTVTHQRNPFHMLTTTAGGSLPRFHNSTSTMMKLVGSLYLIYIPYCGVILWEVCSDLCVSNDQFYTTLRFVESMASFFLACSSLINGFFYGLKSPTLRRLIRNYRRKRATKSELQQEIRRAKTPNSQPLSGNTSFCYPPLQRRLSETDAYSKTGSSFESNNFGSQRSRMQPAASCNTLRMSTVESGVPSNSMRASASAANLMSPHYRSDFIKAGLGASCSVIIYNTSKKSPKILITRAYSEENQNGEILLRKSFIFNTDVPPCEKHRWRHCSTGSESSTESSDAYMDHQRGPELLC